MLVLRTCQSNMTSNEGRFTWPESGPVQAPDWDPKPECGQGLHGLAHGEGDGFLLSWSPDAKWLIVEVPDSTVVDLDGKVKFPSGVVVHCGTQETATKYLQDHGCAGRAIVGATTIAGAWGTAIAGDGGTANAGEFGKAIAGDFGKAIAGIQGTATVGEFGTASTGEFGRIQIDWHDGNRWRIATGYVGEGGIEPGVAYKLDGKGNFVKA